jgi:hypothetical protein
MVRILPIASVIVALAGCPPKEKPAPPTAEQVAAYQAEAKEAQKSRGFWQNTATFLGFISLITLAVGMVLGSSARKDADE